MDSKKLQWLRAKVAEAEKDIKNMEAAAKRIEELRQFAINNLRHHRQWLAELEAQEAQDE